MVSSEYALFLFWVRCWSVLVLYRAALCLFFGVVLVVLLHCISLYLVVLLFVMLYIVVRSAMLIRKVYAGFVVVLLLVVGISLRP